MGLGDEEMNVVVEEDGALGIEALEVGQDFRWVGVGVGGEGEREGVRAHGRSEEGVADHEARRGASDREGASSVWEHGWTVGGRAARRGTSAW